MDEFLKQNDTNQHRGGSYIQGQREQMEIKH